MAVYLIDFENVTSAGISGIQRLTKEDKVYIFYTVNASNMSFAAHLNLLSSPAEVIYYNVTSGGKNALDFQLASFLGYLISKGEDKDFYIISNDKGYDHVKNFWERSGIAAGVTINGAPSINRSLMPLEKPFMSKIQQTNVQQGTVTLEQMKAETDKYVAQKTAAKAAKASTAAASTAAEASAAAMSAENEEAAKEEAVKAAKTARSDKKVSPNEAAAEKPVKRRGRPRKQTTETTAENSAKTNEVPANSEEILANQAEILAEIEKDEKKPAKKSKTSSKKGKTPAKKKNDSDVLKNALRPLLAKAKIKSEDEVANVANYFKLADGKQQFYRNLITLYGMERGVEVYRVVRTEYTNLTKLVKQ